MKLKILFLLPLALLLAACSDDTPEFSKPGGIIYEDGLRVSELSISEAAGVADWADGTDVHFRLDDPVRRVTLDFEGTVRHSPSSRGQALNCRLKIGTADIPDGDYYLSIVGENIPDIGRHRVRFSGNVGMEIGAESMDYSDLEGSGTASDPYLIGNQDDFLSLIWYLEEDPEHAYGLYFRQTASFDVPRRSIIIDGRVYAPVTFSGNYDGGGYELRALSYQGSSDPTDDSDVGLFKDLHSSTVKNLKIVNALLLNVYSRAGAVAGSCTGACTFENISVSGTFTAAKDDIGAVVGRSEGSVTYRKISLNSVVIDGSQTDGYRIGLLAGCHQGDKITVENVSVPDHIFSVSGKERVGGLLGEIKCKDVSIKNVNLEHSVDQESSDTKVIYGSGRFVGGTVGWFEPSVSAEIRSCSIKAPVRGAQDVGGLFGHAIPGKITLSAVQLSSVVKGDVSVGGFFGYLGFRSGGGLVVEGDDNTTRLVVKSSADAEVNGGTHVGGFAGYLDAQHGTFAIKSEIQIAVNVKGTENVGGAVGYADHLDRFNPYCFNFSSPTMRVEATGDNAGGVFGQTKNSVIDGTLRFNPVDKLPGADSQPTCFDGVVTSARAAGGVVGTASGSVTGVCSGATVTSTAMDAGGICGFISTEITNCMFTGTVDAQCSAGGIYAVCKSEINVEDCVNYGKISGHDNVGGIGGFTRTPDNGRLMLTRCYNGGQISGGCTGGLWGYVGSDNTDHKNDKFDITYCGNAGRVTGNGGDDNAVAGIVARINHRRAYVAHCTNLAEVSGPRQSGVAGVVGDIGDHNDLHYNYGHVSGCVNYGKISSSHGDTRVGGVVGCIQRSSITSYGHKLSDCANYGEVPSDQKHDNGGILGFADEFTDIYRNFNAGNVSHGNAAVGDHQGSTSFHHHDNYFVDGSGKDWPSSTRVGRSDVGKESSYPGLDFKDAWTITSEGPRPRHAPFQP